MKSFNRRNFLRLTGLGAAGLGFLPQTFGFAGKQGLGKPIKIGWITDLHHGYCTDAQVRLETFLATAEARNPDFIIQGGDFCHPTIEAEPFLKAWHQYKGAKYHVLGNHDMDKGSKQQIMEAWEMSTPYYAFEQGDFRFLVLDCNYLLKDGQYIDYDRGNFYIPLPNRDLVHPNQIEWLRGELAQTNKPCVIISHQSLDEIWGGYGVPNRLAVRKVIDEANNRPDGPKVIACFCGHHHLDDYSYINKVHYFQMNSASYYYTGEGFGSDGAKAMYKDPLFAFVTLDPAGSITIEGRQSSFLPPTPMQQKHPDAARISANISNRSVGINPVGWHGM